MAHEVFCEKCGELEGYIFTPDMNFEYGRVVIDNYVIKSVEYFEPADSTMPRIISCEDAGRIILGQEISAPIIIPGLVDVHLHGANGYDICDADCRSLAGICDYERQSGIAAFIGATMTLPVTELETICNAYNKLCLYKNCSSITNDDIKPYAGFEGLFLEGPFISKNRCGAQNPQNAIAPDYEIVKRLNDLSGGIIRKVLVAPEIEGAERLTKEIVMSTDSEETRNVMSTNDGHNCENNTILDVNITLGHTDCDYNTASKLIEVGANQVTHLYNAMPPFDKREPGLIGAALDNDCYMELICDGVHVHDSVIRATFNMVSEDKIVLVSDSTMATGLLDGPATLGGTPVSVVTADGVRRVELMNGTIAGSATNLFDCMIHAIKIGVPVDKAIVAATVNPATSVQLDDFYGRIDEGKCGIVNIFRT